MIRRIIFNFFCLLVVNIGASYAGDRDEQEADEAPIEQRLTVKPYTKPCELNIFCNFFQDQLFWTERTTLNPDIFSHLIQNYPKVPLANPCITEIFESSINSALSCKFVLGDLTELSKEILKIYKLKYNGEIILSFDPSYYYDRNILHEALSSFLRIINTPDPDRAQGDEWKAQTFIRVFSHLWAALNGVEENVEFNLALRQSIALVAGLNPDFQYEDTFSNFYPNLANWTETCVEFIPNRSGKPIAMVLTYSLMHALTEKVRFLSAINNAPRITFIVSGSWSDEKQDTLLNQPYHTTKNLTLPAKKAPALTNSRSGRRRSFNLDTKKTVIPRSLPSGNLQAFISTLPELGPKPFDLAQNSTSQDNFMAPLPLTTAKEHTSTIKENLKRSSRVYNFNTFN